MSNSKNYDVVFASGQCVQACVSQSLRQRQTSQFIVTLRFREKKIVTKWTINLTHKMTDKMLSDVAFV